MLRAASGLLASLVLLLAGSAGAVTISLVPSSATVQPGGSVDVDITFSGLGAGSAPSIGVYDLNVLFDANMSLTNVAFGDPVLGDQLALVIAPSLNFSVPVAGMVQVFELSFDGAATLDNLQADQFIAARLTFEAVGGGSADFSTTVNSVGLSDGSSATIDDLVGASVSVIPEPSALLLFPLGLAVVARRTRRAPAR